ncbi:hypothetical protein P7266_0797 [Lactococcus cremoris]|nr:hypothetical protein P7266_0797 [Lactococcus cremoris]
MHFLYENLIIELSFISVLKMKYKKIRKGREDGKIRSFHLSGTV